MRVGCGVNALSDLRFYPCAGLIRRASVASGNDCRMRRERLIRPTVLPLRRPDKTRQRRIRQRLSDAAYTPYPTYGSTPAQA
ncbi:hypothetical protein [Escherichia coli]|uniref:hypothetical protein n=2 Tax=Escherichia coli TaxID=562 RepID=UPI002FBE6150